MDYRFCSVFRHGKQAWLVRQSNANGPRCMQWPPQPLADDIDAEALRRDIVAALAGYDDLGRGLAASEWAVLNQRLLDFFGEKTVAAFERKKTDITIRQNVAAGNYSLFGSGKHLKNYVAESLSLDDAIAAVLEGVVRR